MHKYYCPVITGFDKLLQNLWGCSNSSAFICVLSGTEWSLFYIHDTNFRTFTSVALKFHCLGQMLFGMNKMPLVMVVCFLHHCTFCSIKRNFHALPWLLVFSPITSYLSIITATHRFRLDATVLLLST